MGDETADRAYREKLRDVRQTVKICKSLMASEEEEIRARAIDLFLKLSELEIALVEALQENPENQAREERNPLVRRAQLDW